MPQLRKISGEKLLKILCNKLGFSISGRKGSHIRISKETPSGKIGTVIPMHNELKIGTLMAILKQARVTPEEISEFL